MYFLVVTARVNELLNSPKVRCHRECIRYNKEQQYSHQPILVLQRKMQHHKRCRGTWYQSNCTSWTQQQQCNHSDVVIPHQGPVLVFLHSPALGCISQLLSLPPDWHTDIFQGFLQGFCFTNTAMLWWTVGNFQVFSYLLSWIWFYWHIDCWKKPHKTENCFILVINNV